MTGTSIGAEPVSWSEHVSFVLEDMALGKWYVSQSGRSKIRKINATTVQTVTVRD